jgi:hypothetical protein
MRDRARYQFQLSSRRFDKTTSLILGQMFYYYNTGLEIIVL